MGIIVNDQETYKQNNSKKIIKIIIILLIILLIIAGAALAGIYYLRLKEFKVIINDERNLAIENVFKIEDGKIYVAIKDIASFLGYTSYNGEYKEYSEDKTKCYLKGQNEVVTYSLDSNIIYKSIISEKISENNSSITNTLTVANSDYEYYTLEEPVRLIDDKLYCSLQGIEIGTNVKMIYTEKNNTINIYTLDNLVKRYAIAVSDMATDATYTFSNMKAVLYNYIIVKNDDNKYGVSKFENGKLQEVIGKKYAYIKFIEGSQEFIVLTDEGKMGIIKNDGTTSIEPIYDEIKQIEKDEKLYLVSNDKKYGIIKNDGEIVIYLEYDQIGVDSLQFSADNIENQYILYNKCIPVKKGDKWGLLDKKGNIIADFKYDSFGAIVDSSSQRTSNSFILIPEYEGIVAVENSAYTLINANGEVLIPYNGYVNINSELVTVSIKQMYSEIISNEHKYYLVYETDDNRLNQKYSYDIIEFLKDVLKKEPINS